MTRNRLVITIVLLMVVSTSSILFLRGADSQGEHARKFEYATIRWSGRDNTHVVRPSGEVEFVGPQFEKIKKPNRADDRSFYMNVVMNALSKEGYEFVGISNDDIVMKRPVVR
jgi:hypothetical protein